MTFLWSPWKQFSENGVSLLIRIVLFNNVTQVRLNNIPNSKVTKAQVPALVSFIFVSFLITRQIVFTYRYKERLELKYLRRNPNSASLNSRNWVFVHSNLDDMRTGVPLISQGKDMVVKVG